MLLTWIWAGMALISIAASIYFGSGGALAAAVPQGAQAGITLAISMAGALCLWSGVGALMEKLGLSGKLARLLKPFLNRVFPSSRRDPVLAGCLSGNLCANLLGLGNAATPLGIQAAKRMAEKTDKGVASNELCRLIVLNTASIQLIPSTVAALRAGYGSKAPFDILPAVWITSICSAVLGLLAAWILGRRHD